ncbi:MAG TPA: hypothetical protein VN812_09310 [Candidatus Acidoferrales bacterium]|nr:hypothetical protein [Candidatus Acidoferrales bacterium]
MATQTQPVPSAREPTRQRLDCATVSVELVSDDAAVIDFVVEYFNPWFRPTQRATEWLIMVTSAASAYVDMQHRLPADAAPLPCFAHDQQVLSMPAWPSGDVVNVCDADRSCFLRIRPGQVDLIADASTRRWRFTLLWILLEIAATRLRQTHVDVHAACVERAGRALLIAGPKNAGKTTLSFHLMRSHGCRSIANDRCFIGGEAPALVVAGMPTAVKIRPQTLTEFPELHRGLPPVARPYLYTLAELETASPSEERPDAVDFALTPNQLALRLGADTHGAAPLGAIVFPQVCDDEATWAVEPLPTEDVVAGVYANLYGAASGGRPATFFEELGGGQRRPSRRLVAAIAAAVAGYRVRLGRDAYADGTLGKRLLQLLTS